MTYETDTKTLTNRDYTSDQHKQSKMHSRQHIHCQPLSRSHWTLVTMWLLPVMVAVELRWLQSTTLHSGEDRENDNDSEYPKLVLYNLHKIHARRPSF